MTNAPFILNVDCDMFANNPQLVYHAMCIFLGSESERESGFIQFPQIFYNGLKDDPFGNEFKVFYQYHMVGIAGIQGPFHEGTGCFHRRKIINGSTPYQKLHSPSSGSSKEELQKRYGNSQEFIASAMQMLLVEDAKIVDSWSLPSTLDAAYQVASCTYELSTCWGNEVGWVYGSTTEDIFTGIKIHSMGWKSAFCTPNPPAFLGCVPSDALTSLTQQKRWGTGLLEILFPKNGVLLTALRKKLEFRQSMAYISFVSWALRSIPELCYTALPPFCLLTGTAFLPRISEPVVMYPVGAFIFYNLHTLLEYLCMGLFAREWWNNMRMRRIISATAWLFSVLNILLKLLGISDTVFHVTRKEETPDATDNKESGRFTFDSSPLFVPGTTLLFLNITALLVGLMKMLFVSDGWSLVGVCELICSAWLVLNFLPFLKGLFKKGNYGIPWSIILKSALLTLVFFHFFWRVSKGEGV